MHLSIFGQWFIQMLINLFNISEKKLSHCFTFTIHLKISNEVVELNSNIVILSQIGVLLYFIFIFTV